MGGGGGAQGSTPSTKLFVNGISLRMSIKTMEVT